MDKGVTFAYNCSFRSAYSVQVFLSDVKSMLKLGAAQIFWGNVSLVSWASRPQPVSAPAPVEELLQEVTDASCLWPESNPNSPDLLNKDAA